MALSTRNIALSIKRLLNKPHGRDSYLTLAGFTIGAIASGLLSMKILKDVSGPAKVFLSVGILVLTTWLGWLSDKIKHIATKVPDRRNVESSHVALMRELATENALLHLERVSKPVHAVVSGYAKTKVCHLIEHGEVVFIDEYLDMLERSLALADKEIFATSLLLPETWLADDSYRNYLRDQKRKVQASQIHIRRVFVCPKEAFEGNSDALSELKELHEDSQIALGFCDKDKLIKRFGKAFYKDFVMFGATDGSWVIDGGKLEMKQSSRDRSPINVIVHYRPESVNNRFKSLEHRITQLVATGWIVQPDWLKLD